VSPTSSNLRLLANTEKLLSDDDINDNNNKLNDFLNNDSISMTPTFKQSNNNDDMINNIINNETKSLNKDDEQDIGNHTINLSNDDDETFKPPEDLDNYQRANQQEKRLMKFTLLRKLAKLKQEYGIQLYTDYSLNDDYYDIKREYDYHTGERAKRQAVENYADLTIGSVKFLEMLSKRFTLLNNSYFNLSGWSNQVKLRKEELICILEELYEKYSMGPSQAAPETKFLMLILTSAAFAGVGNFTSNHLVKGLFNNNNNIQNMEDIEIDVTKQNIINQNLNKNNIQPNQTDQDVYNKIYDDASKISTNIIQQQQIRKGNYDINEKYKNELINRGLEKTYNNTQQPELEPPDVDDIPSIIQDDDNNDSEKKKKPKFRKSKKNN